MDFLRRLLTTTQTYLKGMSGSQRLAIGSCVALIALALLWLVNWAGQPSLVPLLDQPLSAQEIVPIQQQLDAQSVVYKVTSANTILVPAESRPRLLAQLGQQKALPNDISIGFARMMEDSSPWLSMEEQSRRWSIARSYELSRVLREFDGVVDARVLLDDKTRRSLGSAPVTPTASIFVKMTPGMPLDKDRVHAMASFVSRAVAGLDITNVAVTDATTGRSYSVPKATDALAFSDLEDRRVKEEYYAERIRSLLAHIPGLLVAVHAELSEESKRETVKKFGKPAMLTDKTETSTMERAPAGSGPGVVPNTGRAVTPSGIVEKTEKSTSETNYDGKVDETLTMTEAPRHTTKRLSASVVVPRSWLAGIYRSANKGKDPTDGDIDAGWTVHQKKIASQVETALGIPKGSGGVEVGWFHDEAVVQMNEAVQAGAGEDIMTLARTYGGKVGVGALGVMGLLMMLMMVRKVSEGPVLPGEEPPAPRTMRGRRSKADETMVVSAEPVGRAEVTENLLVAREVDEQTVRTQQVVQQVQDMIKEDPGGATSILQRWIDLEKN